MLTPAIDEVISKWFVHFNEYAEEFPEAEILVDELYQIVRNAPSDVAALKLLFRTFEKGQVGWARIVPEEFEKFEEQFGQDFARESLVATHPMIATLAIGCAWDMVATGIENGNARFVGGDYAVQEIASRLYGVAPECFSPFNPLPPEVLDDYDQFVDRSEAIFQTLLTVNEHARERGDIANDQLSCAMIEQLQFGQVIAGWLLKGEFSVVEKYIKDHERVSDVLSLADKCADHGFFLSAASIHKAVCDAQRFIDREQYALAHLREAADYVHIASSSGNVMNGKYFRPLILGVLQEAGELAEKRHEYADASAHWKLLSDQFTPQHDSVAQHDHGFLEVTEADIDVSLYLAERYTWYSAKAIDMGELSRSYAQGLPSRYDFS